MRTVRAAMIVAAVLTSAIAAPLAAQGQGGGGRQGGDPAAMQARQNERLFDGITLTAEQKAKVDSIQTAARAAQQSAMQGGGMRDPEARQRMMAQRQATMAAIRAVLTAEQQTKFDANLASMPAMGAGGRPPEGQRPPRQ
jgi:protein CpxP